MVSNIKNAVILVAGLGSRLKPLTNEVPKCLTEINGKPILINTLEILSKNGINRAIIVIGYLGDKVKEAIGSNFNGMEIVYIENTIYQSTNSMYSAWLARSYLEEGAFLIEGDSMFEDGLIRKALGTDNNKSFWVVDKFTEEFDGSMSTTDENGRIVKLEIVREKLNNYQDNFYKSTGIVKITPDYGICFSRWLDEDVKAGNINIYYDLVLSKHLDKIPLYVCNINGLKWFEIDDLEDLKITTEIFSNEEQKLFKDMNSEIVPIERLKPLEMVFPNHLNNLKNMILSDGFVKSPILADRKTGIVLDGSHRYIFFLMEGYKTVPVHFVDYDDENIRVGTKLMHRHMIEGSTNISKDEVKNRGLSGELFSPRTTRHFFSFRKIDYLNLPLSKLDKGGNVEVSKYIANADIKEEINHNIGYINEIEFEIDEIIRYLGEIRKTKRYLKDQIKRMEINEVESSTVEKNA